MSKIKNEETIGLHHVPFTIMWMAVAAVAFSLLLISILIVDSLRIQFQFIENIVDWFLDIPYFDGVLAGIIVGIIASIGQTWLLRQRYGSAPRYWRLMTIPGWGLAGGGLFILMDYQLHRDFGVYGIFAWFFIPGIFQTIALRSYVRGAWLYALVGTLAAFIAVAAYNQAYQYYDVAYGLSFGALAHPILTAWVLITLMARQRKVNMKAKAA